ncbi:hypothetical protein N864_21215 [Intrasporangium chromatireducens Q5-1]|uniref:Uncharacterized protein n=1 Tax=Intrasporangium chromatireducens Q5-1 TaxID=584657 RepID=W9GK19_9MICO|nr:DUF2017 domain-containing protein [Intrasporangium chromatireducens]EWT06445.1 hypothetical protein N864_21215 [Intrasporangium chromatireducens Q5-1]
MARAFLRDGDRIVAVLDETERAVLSGLMEQTRLLLAPEVEPTGDAWADLVASMGGTLDVGHDDRLQGHDDVREPGRDPALDRLLPAGHRGDDAVASEFRRLTEEGLRQRKSGNLDVALSRLAAADDDQVDLDLAQATAFVMALTDVRLLLGERLGIRTEEDAESLYASLAQLDDDDPAAYAVAWYDFLTWLQETLTSALMGEPGSTV